MPGRRTPTHANDRARRGLLGLAVAVLTLAGPAGSWAAPQEATAPIQVVVREGLLTVELRDAPLTEVLRIIGEQAGFKVTTRGDLSTRVTQSFADVPLDEGIMRLVRGHSRGVSYAFARDAAGAEVLAEVWVTGISSVPPAPTRVGVQGTQQRAAQLRAIRELTRRRDPAAAAALAQILSDSADPVVRARATTALGAVGGDQAAAALTRALGDAAPSVRMQAIRAFRRVDREQAPQVLRGILLGDPDPRVRRVAALTLSGLRTEEARQALEAATSDPDESVRRAVTLALSRWRPAAE